MWSYAAITSDVLNGNSKIQEQHNASKFTSSSCLIEKGKHGEYENKRENVKSISVSYVEVISREKQKSAGVSCVDTVSKNYIGFYM